MVPLRSFPFVFPFFFADEVFERGGASAKPVGLAAGSELDFFFHWTLLNSKWN
jgi:hypothetical protein